MALIGVAALVALAAAGVPAQAQTSSEPTEVVDVDDFADRAQQWSEARRRAREEALRRAEELANPGQNHDHDHDRAANDTADAND